MTLQSWIDRKDSLSLVRQCTLAGFSRATFYAQQQPKRFDENKLLLSKLTDEGYTRHPFYRSRKMVVFLKSSGHTVNRKRVRGCGKSQGWKMRLRSDKSLEDLSKIFSPVIQGWINY
jgi:putative transposase